MSENNLSYPKICKTIDGKYFIRFYMHNKRFRLFSGKKIKSSLCPNTYPLKERKSKTKLLAKVVYGFLIKNESFSKKLDPIELFDSLIRNKFKEPLSVSYLKTLTCLAQTLKEELVSKGKISIEFINSIPLRYNNNTSYNTTRRHLNVLVNYLYENNFPIKRSKLKGRKQEETLHKPIEDVKKLLAKVKAFNEDLYLCCLLIYGCLLRPHQEIRLLKWEDFTSDLSHIRLSGNQVKSKRNRIVPVSTKIREILSRKEGHLNIFTGLKQPYSRSYFIQLWRRFKRLNPSYVDAYNYRGNSKDDLKDYSGAIEDYNKVIKLEL